MSEDELWGLTFRRLVAWTMRKHGLPHADAEEMVEEAIVQFLNSGSVTPSDPRELLQALGSRINGIAVNRRRKKALHAVMLTADGSPAELDDPPDPEKVIASDDVARKAVSTLLERVAGDDVVSSIIMCMVEGVEEPTAQAKAMSLDVREVYNAKRRLKTHVEAVKKLMETW